MTVNINVLRDMVEWVEWQATLDLEKRSWNQELWFLDVTARLTGDLPMGCSTIDMHDPEGHYLSRSTVEERPHCGTAMCAAGYITQFHPLEGLRHVGDQLMLGEKEVSHATMAEKILGIEDVYIIDGDGDDREASDALFDAGNTAADIRAIAEKIAGQTL